MFTFTENDEAQSDVTFVSVYKDKTLQPGLCKSGMVEFLSTSGIYKSHHNNVKIAVQGHIFSQGDLTVRLGIVSMNFPKFLIVQVSYEPAVFIRKSDTNQVEYQNQRA